MKSKNLASAVRVLSLLLLVSGTCALAQERARADWHEPQDLVGTWRLQVTPVYCPGVGGLTMGADPVALAMGMISSWAKDAEALRIFCVRKAPKGHGQTKLIEGNFKAGDTVVVVDDVVTSGNSTITAINAVLQEGGKVAFAAVLVDRQEGGREKIEAMGYPLLSLFQRDELLGGQAS